MKRCLAILMSIVLIIGLLPVVAFASVQAADDAFQIAGITYDVSSGQYKPYDTVRRLYTRPVELTTSPDSGQKLYRTVELDLSNPIYDGADLAIRYTGDDPYFLRADDSWSGWVWMGAGDPGVRKETAEDGTGQKVLIFSRSEFEQYWNTNGTGKPGEHLYVAVHSQSSSHPANSETCNLVEVVALGGIGRINLTQAQKVKVVGLNAWQIAYNMQAGYNMAGHFDSNWVPSSPAKDGGWSYSDLMLEANFSKGVYITRDTIRNLKKEGFNAIRLPVTWFQHIYPEGNPTASVTGIPSNLSIDELVARYHIDRAWMERVHEVVDWCIAEDMYVIVNIHHEDWIDRSDLGTAYDNTDQPYKFKAVWTQIANEFAGYDQRLVFEDMNEPHAAVGDSWGYSTAETVTTVNRLNADFVALMRSMNAESRHSDRLLMMAHDTGNGTVYSTSFIMPEDKTADGKDRGLLAHSLHCYAPHEYTHYFADNAHSGEDGSLNVYTDSYRDNVEARWADYRSRYIAKGEPIILGEFGCYYCGEERQSDRLEWITQYATHAKELGMPMFYWRMDRTRNDENGKIRVDWSAFDEVNQEVSVKSSAMFKKWFGILNDSDVQWGEGAQIDEGEHVSIEGLESLKTSGNSALPKVIDHSNDADPDYSYRLMFKASWEDLQGNEVAVLFNGATPRMGLIRSSENEEGKKWTGNDWGLSPYCVSYGVGTDEENGRPLNIAYFSAETIATQWATKCPTYPLATLSHFTVRTPDSGGKTTEDAALSASIKSVVIIHKHDWGAWTKVVEPTCTQEGKKVRTCSSDASHALTRTIPALGHTWAAAYTVDRAATYATAGSKSIHCTHCDASKPGSDISIPKLVVPAVSLKKLKAAKKGFTATWKKASGVNGYQLQYGLKKNFKGAKKASTNKAKATSKKVTKLKAKKKYYVRIRAFKKVNGKTYYSSWSKVKTVKTKR